MSQRVITQEPNRTSTLSVELDPVVARRISDAAAQQRTRVALLVNEILEQYLASRPAVSRSNGAAFLLSLAGMFRSGTSDTSENVHAIVADFLENRERETDGRTD